MAGVVKKKILLPPHCGEDLSVPLLYNPYQQEFQAKRRMRFCLTCQKRDPQTQASGSTAMNGVFTCPFCQTVHTSNLTAPRLYDRLLVLAGRGGGKTLIGAHAAREEMMVPYSKGWVLGPTYKILHDSTFPTLIRLIPPDWIQRWDPEHMEVTLTNGAMVAFRSLEDPERARGPHGIGWGWFDEAAQSPERAYDVFEPTLIKAGGIVIATTTVLGYDWTYDKIEKRAMRGDQGYWFVRYWTEENPLFASNPVMRRQIDRAKLTMTPEFYAQEYRAERRNAEGLIYSYKAIEEQTLVDDDAIREFIPEWPLIDARRPTLVGLDSGVDHPFGALKLVVTERGLVAVDEYLTRLKALTQHLDPIRQQFFPSHVYPNGRPAHLTWAANKNEANLRLEYALKNVDIFPAESKHEIGVQRVQAWLVSKQLFFAYTVPKTIEQMQSYRWANNRTADDQRKKEQVFKKDDELPDALRYAVMAWPELPNPDQPARSPTQQRRWDTLSDKAKQDIEAMRAYDAREQAKDLNEKDATYPIGEFFGHVESFW